MVVLARKRFASSGSKKPSASLAEASTSALARGRPVLRSKTWPDSASPASSVTVTGWSPARSFWTAVAKPAASTRSVTGGVPATSSENRPSAPVLVSGRRTGAAVASPVSSATGGLGSSFGRATTSAPATGVPSALTTAPWTRVVVESAASAGKRQAASRTSARHAATGCE